MKDWSGHPTCGTGVQVVVHIAWKKVKMTCCRREGRYTRRIGTTATFPSNRRVSIPRRATAGFWLLMLAATACSAGGAKGEADGTPTTATTPVTTQPGSPGSTVPSRVVDGGRVMGGGTLRPEELHYGATIVMCLDMSDSFAEDQRILAVQWLAVQARSAASLEVPHGPIRFVIHRIGVDSFPDELGMLPEPAEIKALPPRPSTARTGGPFPTADANLKKWEAVREDVKTTGIATATKILAFAKDPGLQQVEQGSDYPGCYERALVTAAFNGPPDQRPMIAIVFAGDMDTFVRGRYLDAPPLRPLPRPAVTRIVGYQCPSRVGQTPNETPEVCQRRIGSWTEMLTAAGAAPTVESRGMVPTALIPYLGG
jgi:hypothetical protein